MDPEIPIIWITGPWSSGSTALTGWFENLGAYGCPPYQKTNDPRTPNSYESKALRDKLCECRNELTLETKDDALEKNLLAWFQDWKKTQESIAIQQGHNYLVLKHPLLAYYIQDLRSAADRIILITRPLQDIEKTRRRRGWHKTYGNSGAKLIYSKLFNTYLKNSISYQAVAYAHFLTHEPYRKELAQNLKLLYSEKQWKNAEQWIKNGR